MSVDTGSFNRTFSEVTNAILTQLTGSTVKIKMEPHLFFVGLQHYPLLFANATEISQITGVFSGSQITFVQNVDYDLTAQNEVDFGLTGSTPDNNTVFYVGYRYALPYTSVITDVNIGSIVRTVIESVAAELGILSGSTGGLYRLLREIYYSGFISFSSGSSLDFLSALLGVVRKAPTASIGQVTFSRFDSGSGVIIPEGTVVQTRSTLQDDPILFQTTDDLTLYALTGSATIGAQAVVPGSSGNVGVGTITIMQNQTSIINSVTNTLPFTGGADAENDDALRLRSLSQLETLARATLNSLKFSILSQEGVSNVVVADLSRGPGTADVIVLTNVLPIPYDLKQTILDTIDEYKAAGVDIDLREPVVEAIDIECTIQLSSDPGVNQSVVKRQVTQNLADYINSLGLGDNVVYNKLIDEVMNVYGVKDASITSPAQNIHIFIDEVARVGIIDINFV